MDPTIPKTLLNEKMSVNPNLFPGMLTHLLGGPQVKLKPGKPGKVQNTPEYTSPKKPKRRKKRKSKMKHIATQLRKLAYSGRDYRLSDIQKKVEELLPEVMMQLNNQGQSTDINTTGKSISQDDAKAVAQLMAIGRQLQEVSKELNSVDRDLSMMVLGVGVALNGQE